MCEANFVLKFLILERRHCKVFSPRVQPTRRRKPHAKNRFIKQIKQELLLLNPRKHELGMCFNTKHDFQNLLKFVL